MAFLRKISNLFFFGSAEAAEASSASDSEPRNSSVFHHPSERDVLKVEGLLLEVLPLELVQIIMDRAEYYPRLEVRRDEKFDIKPSSTNANNAECCYLVTPPLPPNCHVRKVVFATASHDQGWGGNPQDKDTYNGSWTWFETSILRCAPEYPDTPAPAWLRAVEDGARLLHNFRSSLGRWLVQKNVCASIQTKIHEIVWSCHDSTDNARDDTTFGRVDAGGEFVRNLRPGDRIVVLGRAMFPGWSNHVDGVSVQVFYSRYQPMV